VSAWRRRPESPAHRPQGGSAPGTSGKRRLPTRAPLSTMATSPWGVPPGPTRPLIVFIKLGRESLGAQHIPGPPPVVPPLWAEKPGGGEVQQGGGYNRGSKKIPPKTGQNFLWPLRRHIKFFSRGGRYNRGGHGSQKNRCEKQTIYAKKTNKQ